MDRSLLGGRRVLVRGVVCVVAAAGLVVGVSACMDAEDPMGVGVASTSAASDLLVPRDSEETSPATSTTTDGPAATPVGAGVRVLVPIEGLEAIRPGVSRLAYVDAGAVYVLAQGDAPWYVGSGENPVWSLDGRYIAWSTRLSGWVFNRENVNAPTPYDLVVLDTETGERAVYIGADPGLSGRVLGVDDGFIAVVNGENNVGRAATTFAHIEPPLLFDGITPAVVEAQFVDLLSRDEQPAATHYDFDWTDSGPNTAYVVVTDHSTTWYRYNPEIWSVSLQGNAIRLPDGCVDDCQNNAGFHPVAVSPDERMVFVDDAYRNGCEVLSAPTLIDFDQNTRTRMSTLPTSPPEPPYPAVSFFGNIEWTSIDKFTAVITQLGLPQDPDERCSYPVLVPSQLYECDTSGTCEPLGIETEQAAISPDGDLAHTTNEVSGGSSKLVLVQWADGSSSNIIIQYGMAWAP